MASDSESGSSGSSSSEAGCGKWMVFMEDAGW